MDLAWTWIRFMLTGTFDLFWWSNQGKSFSIFSIIGGLEYEVDAISVDPAFTLAQIFTSLLLMVRRVLPPMPISWTMADVFRPFLYRSSTSIFCSRLNDFLDFLPALLASWVGEWLFEAMVKMKMQYCTALRHTCYWLAQPWGTDCCCLRDARKLVRDIYSRPSTFVRVRGSRTSRSWKIHECLVCRLHVHICNSNVYLKIRFSFTWY